MPKKQRKFADDGWAIWIDGDDTSTVYINDWLNPKGKSYVDVAIRIRGVKVSKCLHVYVPFVISREEIEDLSLLFQDKKILQSTFSAACIVEYKKNEYTAEIAYNGKTGNYYITTCKEQTGYIHADYCSLIEFSVGENKVEKAISFGTELLGYPYVWGSQRYHWGNGILNKNFVNGEFDCSAFVQYIYYKTNNVLLDVTSRAQSTEGKLVEKKDLKRGDLMFFTNALRKDKEGIEKVGHVGIYFGDNYILHTASDYAVLEPISEVRWSYYLHSRRVV